MTERRTWDPDELAASWASPPGLGRCLGIGSGIGVAVAFLGVAVPSLLSGMEPGAALGFGVFVAFWGGLGFGSMMGGVAYVTGLEKAAAAATAAEEPEGHPTAADIEGPGEAGSAPSGSGGRAVA